MAGKSKSSAKQKSLEGMEDREIKELQDAAISYAEIRDERMSLNRQEIELKEKLLALMKAHKKQTYVYNGVEVNIVHEEETVKVKVKKQDSEAEE
jgi:hypothetical protein